MQIELWSSHQRFNSSMPTHQEEVKAKHIEKLNIFSKKTIFFFNKVYKDLIQNL